MRREFACPQIIRLAAGLVLLLLAAAAPARAADPVFPRNGTIGLVPPPGMVESEQVPGFEDRPARASILIAEMPPQAFAEISGNFAADGLVQQGVTIEKRRAVELAGGVKGVLLQGYQTVGASAVKKWILIAGGSKVTALLSAQLPETASERYPDAAIEAALLSVVLRAPPSLDELVSRLPFRLDLPVGYRIVRVLGGGAALVAKDAAGKGTEAGGAIEPGTEPFFTVAIAQGDIREDDRPSFARRAIASVPGVKEIRPERGGPLRIGGQPGFEIIARGEDARTGKPVKMAQWIAFGRTSFLRMVGVAPEASFDADFTDLRALRDGVALK